MIGDRGYASSIRASSSGADGAEDMKTSSGNGTVCLGEKPRAGAMTSRFTRSCFMVRVCIIDDWAVWRRAYEWDFFLDRLG